MTRIPENSVFLIHHVDQLKRYRYNDRMFCLMPKTKKSRRPIGL